MSLPVVLRRKARAEFDAAVDWYEQRHVGLGAEFLKRVEAAFDRIAVTPEMHAEVYREVRRARVHRFPYSIYYRLRSERIVVLAVFHHKRDPNVWKSRA